MQLAYNNKINEKPLHYFYEKVTFELPKRLSKKNYAIPFNFLKNCYLVRTSAINRYELTFDFFNLLEQEQFDEN